MTKEKVFHFVCGHSTRDVTNHAGALASVAIVPGERMDIHRKNSSSTANLCSLRAPPLRVRIKQFRKCKLSRHRLEQPGFSRVLFHSWICELWLSKMNGCRNEAHFRRIMAARRTTASCTSKRSSPNSMFAFESYDSHAIMTC